MSDASFMEKLDKAELWNLQATVTGVEVATTKFLFGICYCTVDRVWHVRFFARARDFARVWTRARAIACVSGHGPKNYIAKRVVDQNTASGMLRRRKSEDFIACIS